MDPLPELPPPHAAAVTTTQESAAQVIGLCIRPLRLIVASRSAQSGR